MEGGGRSGLCGKLPQEFEKFRGDRLTLYAALDYEQAAAVWAGWEQLYNGCRRVFGATLPLIWDVMRKEGTIDY